LLAAALVSLAGSPWRHREHYTVMAQVQKSVS
jgi:hypothetical protein